MRYERKGVSKFVVRVFSDPLSERRNALPQTETERQSLATMKSNSPRKRERVPLEIRNLRAAQENILAGTGSRLLLFDLDLHDF